MSIASIIQASRERSVAVSGATPTYAAWIAAELANEGHPAVLVTAEEDDAARLAGDVAFFSRNVEVVHIPTFPSSPYFELSTDRETLAARMAGLYRLVRGSDTPMRVVVLAARSLVRRVVPVEVMLEHSASFVTDSEVDRDAAVAAMSRAGYRRVSVVSEHGTFAVRGGVIDVFPSLYRDPVRIELSGDEIETLRTFDVDSQRTLRTLERVDIHPVVETFLSDGADPRGRILAAADAAHHPSKDTKRILADVLEGRDFIGIETLTPAYHRQLAPLSDYLPAEATTVTVDLEAILAVTDEEYELATKHFEDRLDDHKISFAPADHYLEPREAREALERGASIDVPQLRLGTGNERLEISAELGSEQLLYDKLESTRKSQTMQLGDVVVTAIERWRESALRVVVAVNSEVRAQQLRGLLRTREIEFASVSHWADTSATEIALVTAHLSAGFASPSDGLALLSEDEIFGERKAATTRQRAAAKRAHAALSGDIADFADLEPGDFLVHELHGVGRYAGLAKLPAQGSELDFLHIEYRGGTLYLPVYRMGEISRYVGADGRAPKLDKLGGTSWLTTTRKVKREVRALAEELLQLYAQRASLPGHAFSQRDAMFGDFEAMFEFEETPDQAKAIEAVLSDMEEARPMDRLVCGDVGYGKTEVALRAMFKAAADGKQVAFLAPTTVLVEQHFLAMSKRFSGWPIHIAKLSRFQTKKEQAATSRGLANGEIDAVVGTHRLLSNDVRFKNLGLLIIDEEQRFGVSHKEKLKRMRSEIDVLTLTATPIPRTLNLAMSGLRDLSIIATPPADRRSIRTFIARPDRQIIADAIRHELSRGGQVFFVCPTIESKKSRHDRSLLEWADELREIVPEASLAIAHGQLREPELERTMLAFVDGESDVLLATTIIESGLDIPKANTMLIANADRFGLAQLYQLRGRIGRSNVRAHCYLLTPARGKMTSEARKRLETLQRFSSLGAGFAIASQDLEIRGAGELLGAKQSGAIAAVGFEAYAKLLEEAVAELRGESIRRPRDPELNVRDPGFIPDDYVPDVGQRLELYRRLAVAEDGDEISEIISEMDDRYGSTPPDVHRLGELMLLKRLAARLHVQSLELTDRLLVLALADDTPLDPAAIADLLQREPGRFRMTPEMRLRCQLNTHESSSMDAAKGCLLDLLAYVTS